MPNLLKENEIIDMLQKRVLPQAGVVTGIGDDAAVIEPTAGKLLLTSVDQLVCGTHFLPDHEPRSLGHKVLAISISDILAMAAKPEYALLTITAPEVERGWLDGFCTGFFALADEFNVSLIGGNCTHGPLAISTTVLGSVGSDNLLKRSGAKVDDDIWIIGSLGAAACAREEIFATGASHLADYWLYPRPQAAILELASLVNSAMDVSDGLYSDLQKLCVASNCGAKLYWDVLQRQEWLSKCSPQNLQDLILFGGEDYAICVTISESQRASVRKLSAGKFACLHVGKITEPAGIKLLAPGGAEINISDKTWQHF